MNDPFEEFARPHDIEAERGVLSAVLQDPLLMNEACLLLKPEHFYVPAHVTIFIAAITLTDTGHPCDLITLRDYLKTRQLIDKVGGEATLTEIFTGINDASHFAHWANIVRDKWMMRAILNVCTECEALVRSEEYEATSTLDVAEGLILSIGDQLDVGRKELTMRQHVMAAVEEIEQMYESKGAIQGLSTGLRDVDHLLNGLRPGEMIVIAARPSMGKTALGMNIAEHIACDLKLPVAIFSLEMTTKELIGRMMGSRARVDLQRLRSGTPEKRDFPKLLKAAGELANAPMYIDDTPQLSLSSLKAKCRRLKRQHDIKIVIVDYLQLMTGTVRKGSGDNRQVEISGISAGLKGLAKEIGVPILVMAQLNRNPEGRSSGRPRMSDLRESGSIEQDADTVALLTRPERHMDDLADREAVVGEATLIIAKQRNGPTDDIPLTFIGSEVRFTNRSFEDEE